MSSSKNAYPLLPLRNVVVFPKMIVPLFVGRRKSVKALEEVINGKRQLILATQREQKYDDPAPDQIFDIGVTASILQLLKLPEGTVKALVEGEKRVRIGESLDNENFLEVFASPIPEDGLERKDLAALVKATREAFTRYANGRKLSEDIGKELAEIKEPSTLADVVAGHIEIDVQKKQELLEEFNVAVRLEKVLAHLHSEMSVQQVEKKIKSRVKSQMERTQREYYLSEQMKAIQRELGDGSDKDELVKLEQQIENTKFSVEAREKAKSEFRKLKSMGPNTAEAAVVRNYLDWLLSIPWGDKQEINHDLGKAEHVLDRDHFGLEKVKERLVEYIAVQQRVGKVGGTILCLVGPPGVGKTSLGKSAAEATGREFVRVSLGGVRDEAEIRGHRRTYVGSMPGRVIQSLKKGKSVNPLILLDEVDKLGNSLRGDPASALLEVLDPVQNANFVDHYLDVEYDLSDVLFITTANHLLTIPEPLLDRMEVIPIPGYTEEEKIQIATRHIIPEQRRIHGLKSKEIRLSKPALTEIVRSYTKEAGVRNLERQIAKIMRKVVTKIVKEEIDNVTVGKTALSEHLGLAPFRHGLAEKKPQVGIATGLAWTRVGGDLLTIEAVGMPGKGIVKATGKLGTVMKESIEAAATYVRSISPTLGVEPTRFEKLDIHVHVPEGATPKEGPSAGVAMVVAIVSILTGIEVRHDTAMTGEITLRGNVLPIGGLKAKLLAAIRGGIQQVLIPQKNFRELSEIPDEIKESLVITPVSSVAEVLKLTLVREPQPIVWSNESESVQWTPAIIESDTNVGTDQPEH